MSNWITFSPTSGHGNMQITITADTLSSLNDRVATIIGENSQFSLSDSIVITQNNVYSEYLTFYINSAGTINWKASNPSYTKTISYSKDNGATWTDITSAKGGTSFNVNAGDVVLFKGDNSTYSNGNDNNTFTDSTAVFELEGNIMSLVDSTGFSANTTLQSACTFKSLFFFCNVTSAGSLVLPATALTKSCYQSMFQGCSSLTSAPAILPATTLADSCYNMMFDFCSSLITAPELPATTLAEGCYSDMFESCTALTTAPSVLPATTLANGCYQLMFDGCKSLTTAPVISATTLADYCCYAMFGTCTSLTTPPSLSATTMKEGCYELMFADCTGLTSAPTLPATTLESGCYREMFKGCTSLTTAPSLPATTVPGSSPSLIVNGAYSHMFAGCTALTTVPSLPATSVGDHAYYKMFEGCTSLSSIPNTLPFNLATSACCYGMFSGCTSLTTAPELPATGTTGECYKAMFKGCTGITAATSVLPAQQLTMGCYESMFDGCKSLTTAPELPALVLVDNCYNYMFKGCSSLNYIKCLANDYLPAFYLTRNWVGGVSSSGTFVKNANMIGFTWSTGDNGIPNGWTVIDYSAPVTAITINNIIWNTNVPASGGTATSANCSYNVIAYYSDSTTGNVTSLATISGSQNVPSSQITSVHTAGTLTLTATYSGYSSSGSVTIYQDAFVPTPEETYLTFDIVSGGTIKWKATYGSISKTISYSKDNGATWTDIASTTAGATIYVDAGDKVMFKGDNSNYANNENYYNSFSNSTAKFNIYGNIMSLIDSTGFVTATTLTSGFTFCNLFGYCSGLLSAENLILPATTLTDNCYKQMFWGSSSLEKGPISIGNSATTMASGSCMQMFQSCSGLTTAPKLPSTNMANMCYYQMFASCRALNIAPDLPSTTLVPYCYGWMFYSCKSLQYIKCLATDISAEGCTGVWTEDVSPTGTFVKPASMNDWTTGNRGIPNGWTIQNIT